MAEPNALRPYTVEDLRIAIHELDFAQAGLADIRTTLKRYRDAIRSFEADEKEKEAAVYSKESQVKKVASNLEK